MVSTRVRLAARVENRKKPRMHSSPPAKGSRKNKFTFWRGP